MLERHGLVVSEVEGGSDYGRDLLVDLTEDGELTGAVVGIQIKGDKRFVRDDGPWVLSASSIDARFWADSSIPVLGVLWDPDTTTMRWDNLTAYCLRPSAVPLNSKDPVDIPINHVLDDGSLPTLVEHARNYIRETKPTAMLDLFGPGQISATAAVHDCYALGRVDPRAFILLRRSLLSLEGEPLVRAIAFLSYLAGHPDILWHKGNWIPEHIADQVQPTFRWSPAEVHHLLRAVEERIREGEGGWVRGGLGQCLWHLLAADKNLTEVATEVIGIFLRDDDLDSAFRALTLAQGRARDPYAAVVTAMTRYPKLAEHELASYYVAEVERYGFVPVYG